MPFEKGVVHKHKAGRPKGFRGLCKLIQKEVGGDGEQLVEWALSIFEDEEQPFANRWAAFQWLSDRGFGKPLMTVELDAAINIDAQVTAPRLDLASLTYDQRQNLREILERALGRPRDAAVTPSGRVLQIVDGGVVADPDPSDDDR